MTSAWSSAEKPRNGRAGMLISCALIATLVARLAFGWPLRPFSGAKRLFSFCGFQLTCR